MRSAADIQADLDVAYAARRTAMSAQSYSIDSGQGKQTVERASLSDIQKMIRDLQAELEQAQAYESGDTGITSGSFVRY